MTKEQVQAKLQEFIGYLQQEKDINDKLLKVQMTGIKSYGSAQKRLAEHDDLLDELDELRTKKMLPILEELNQFIHTKQKELGIIS